MSGSDVINQHPEPVLVFRASTQEEAEVVRATLAAAGIRAFLDQASPDPVLGAVDPSVDKAWSMGVLVSPADAEAARSLIDDLSPEDAALEAEEEADSTTLLEAEKRANAQ